MVQPSSPHSKPVSYLEVKKKDKPLPCDGENTISIRYTIAGQTQGSVDVMYMVSPGEVVCLLSVLNYLLMHLSDRDLW